MWALVVAAIIKASIAWCLWSIRFKFTLSSGGFKWNLFPSFTINSSSSIFSNRSKRGFINFFHSVFKPHCCFKSLVMFPIVKINPSLSFATGHNNSPNFFVMCRVSLICLSIKSSGISSTNRFFRFLNSNFEQLLMYSSFDNNVNFVPL